MRDASKNVGPRSLVALTVLTVLTAVATSLVLAGGAAMASSSGPSTADGVTVRTETFVDRDRETPAVSGLQLPAKKSRTLATTIWAPSERGKHPLIVFAHGCNGHGRDYEPMLRTWAAAGYVVAAPDFPVSSLGAPGVACTSDVSHQPDDVKFVVDRVLALDRARGGLGRIVDRRKIGVAGHSLGAVTTLGVAFRSCCHDERIDAAISYAGTPLIYGTDFRRMRTPVLLVHGDADPTVRYTGSVGPFTKARGPRYLLTILGGDHGSYLGSGDAVSDAVQRASLDFWAGYLRDDADALARLETDAVVPGATTLQHAG